MGNRFGVGVGSGELIGGVEPAAGPVHGGWDGRGRWPEEFVAGGALEGEESDGFGVGLERGRGGSGGEDDDGLGLGEMQDGAQDPGEGEGAPGPWIRAEEIDDTPGPGGNGLRDLAQAVGTESGGKSAGREVCQALFERGRFRGVHGDWISL